jgi:hypothetical protein
MGFDTREGKRMVIPVSDTQAYRQFGNSVAVPVVHAVAEMMVPRLLRPQDFPLKATAVDQATLELEGAAA